MDKQTLKAEVRKESGKGPARQLRMKGLIPAVFYGPGKSPQNLSISPEALTKALTGPFGRNQVIELEIAGAKELAVVRDLEVEPVSRQMLHADFYSVSLDRPVKTRVPFGTRGRAIGVQKGGVLRQIYRDLPVIATPDKVPARIEVDVSNLDTAGVFRVKEIPLPAGVTVDMPPERPVAAIVAKEKELPEEGAEGAAAPGAPGAAPAAGAAPAGAAPAAGGKDAKAAAPAKDDKKKK
jgi:large subunit ribosomal protein L25